MAGFPSTQWSAIAALQSGHPTDRSLALETLAGLYWKPVYKYLRIKWHKSSEDAEDLTQAFFARAIDKDFFRNYDPAKSRFRTFLRTCLDGFVSNEEKAARAQKRGGDTPLLPLDFHQAEAELARTSLSPEEYFEREWIRSLFSTALETFRKRCEESGKETHFLLFETYDIERDPTKRQSYGELASEFGISATAVTNYLSFARKEFRKLVLEKLREVTGTEQEFRSEARRLFGAHLK